MDKSISGTASLAVVAGLGALLGGAGSALADQVSGGSDAMQTHYSASAPVISILANGVLQSG